MEVLSADDLLLGWQLSRASGNSQAAYEYEAQIRANYPYSANTNAVRVPVNLDSFYFYQHF